MLALHVNGRALGPGEPAWVVAEIGNNHDGSIGQAKALIVAAAEAGADAVKFQTHIAEAEMLPSVPTPPHFDEPRYAFTKRMELSANDHAELKELADARGLVWFSSPFSVEAVELLEAVGTPLYKVASGELTNPPLLEAVAATGKPALLSTGMAGLEDVERAIEVFRSTGTPVVILQCTSSYPCPPEQVNLRAMATLAERFGYPVGLSDHTSNTHTALAAVALGAVCVEKHFTLSRRLYGPDHHSSLEPADLARLVEGVREVQAALGSGLKQHDDALDPVRATFEKSVVASEAIPEGATIERAMLTTKRPGTGIPAQRISDVIGRKAARPIARNELVTEDDLGG